MCVRIFSTTFVCNASHSKNVRERYYYMCAKVSMWSIRYYWQIWIKLEFTRHNFEKYLNVKFHEKLSCGGPVVPCGWTDRQTRKTKLTVAFSNFLKAPKYNSKNNRCITIKIRHFAKFSMVPRVWKF
jgi:hypothetical protein